jgi:hypothetical protein
MKVAFIISLLVPVMAMAKPQIKAKKTPNRKPAQASLSINDLSPEFVALSERIIGRDGTNGEEAANGVTTGDELDALIKDVDSNYASFTDDAQKLLAAQLSFIKIYRGIFYRAAGLVEDYDFVRSGIITALRFTGQATQVYLPTSQWEAGFNYTVEPFNFDPETEVVEINDDATFKEYLVKELIPALQEFDRRIASINFNNVVWDNKVFYSQSNFVDSRDRFFTLSDNEKNALRSVLQASLSAAQGLKAYSMTGLFKTINLVAQKFGINAMFDIGGSLASQRTQIIRENMTLTLVDRAALNASYESLQRAVRFAQDAIDGVALDGNDADVNSLFNFAAINAFTRINNNTINGIANIVLPEGNSQLSSAVVQGEVVQVDLRKMFVDDPPARLVDFLPNGFDEEMTEGRRANRPILSLASDKAKHPVKLVKDGKTYVDFSYGQPNDWNDALFKKYFPGVNNDEDIKKTVRIISQSYGGLGLGLPFSLVMF